MKSIKIILIGMLCTFLVTCNKNEDDDSGGSNNGLKSGQIEIKADPDKDNKISFYATAKKITIDWGDGKVDEFTPNGIKREFVHEYPNQNSQNVSFATESITDFSCGKGTFRELRFGKCTELEEINCSNQQLTVLDVRGALKLKYLYCELNLLTELNIKNAVASLEVLSCTGNSLKTLDVSGASKLKSLNYDGYYNLVKLEELNVKGCTALTYLECRFNQITQLDVSKNTALTSLYCSGNKLAQLNVSNNEILKELSCGGNQLSHIDLSKNTALTTLFCGIFDDYHGRLGQFYNDGNKLTQLDLSNNTELTLLSCSVNQLTQLNLSNNTVLFFLDCMSNKFSDSALNALFESLPDRPQNARGNIWFWSNPGAPTLDTYYCDVSIFLRKNWYPYLQ